jgi:hypothetical protein
MVSTNLFFMYSFWQLIFSILIKFTNLFTNLFTNFTNFKFFLDFCRAGSIFIAITWVGLYLGGKFEKIYNFYKTLFPFLESKLLVFIIDILTHIGPAILLGWPQNNNSFLFAAGILVVWYTMIHKSLYHIYNLTKSDIQQTDIAFYLLLPILTLVLINI